MESNTFSFEDQVSIYNLEDNLQSFVVLISNFLWRMFPHNFPSSLNQLQGQKEALMRICIRTNEVILNCIQRARDGDS